MNETMLQAIEEREIAIEESKTADDKWYENFYSH